MAKDNQDLWAGEISETIGSPENADVVNKKVRILFERNERKIKYDEYGLFTIEDDGKSYQKHALFIDGSSIRLIVETHQILNSDGKLYPMDADTIALVEYHVRTKVKNNDCVKANKFARRLMRRYVSEKKSSATDLVYSSEETDLLKKTFPDAYQVFVHLLLNTSEIEIRICDKGHCTQLQKYKMDERTLKRAKHKAKVDPKYREPYPPEKAMALTLLTVCGGFACLIVSAIIVNNTPRQRRIKKQYEEFKASLPNYDDSIRMAQTPEEFARLKNLKEFNEQRLANYLEELQNSK